MALNKNEMHQYIEQVETDLAKFKDSAPFSVGYYSSSEKLSLFLEVLFKDQGFDVVALDCKKIYSKILPDADEPPRLADALVSLKEKCKTLNNPVIILNRGNYVRNHEIDHDLMVAILKEGINIKPKVFKRGEDGVPYLEGEPQFVPVVISSHDATNWLYMEHMVNTHKFSSKVLNSNTRLKKLWDAKQADAILNQLNDTAELPSEALNMVLNDKDLKPAQNEHIQWGTSMPSLFLNGVTPQFASDFKKEGANIAQELGLDFITSNTTKEQAEHVSDIPKAKPATHGTGAFVIHMKKDIYESLGESHTPPSEMDNISNSAKVEEKIAKMKEGFLENKNSNTNENSYTPKN